MRLRLRVLPEQHQYLADLLHDDCPTLLDQGVAEQRPIGPVFHMDFDLYQFVIVERALRFRNHAITHASFANTHYWLKMVGNLTQTLAGFVIHGVVQ